MRAPFQNAAVIALSVLGFATVAAAVARCPGDCDGDGRIGIRDLVSGVGVALGGVDVDTCRAMDENGDGAVRIDELIGAVRGALDGCAALPRLDGSASAYFLPGPAFAVAGDAPQSLAVGDVDGDGFLDLVTANDGLIRFFDGGVSLLPGTGDGAFEHVLGLGKDGFSAQLVQLLDLDGDGLLDIVAGDDGGAPLPLADPVLYIFRNQGDRQFSFMERVPMAAPPIDLIAADVNCDGRKDVVAGVLSSDDVLLVYLTRADGDLAPPIEVPAPGEGELVALAVGLIDGDDIPDVALVMRESVPVPTYVRVLVLRGVGDGSFSAMGPPVLEGVPDAMTNLSSLQIADVDADGKADLVGVASVGEEDGCVTAFRGRGHGTFAEPQCSAAGQFPSDVVVGDVTGDGKADVVVTSGIAVATTGETLRRGGDVLLFAGMGDGTFTLRQHVGAGAGARAPVAADFNGDGALDVATVNEVSNDASVLLNRGGRLVGWERLDLPAAAYAVAVDDFDGDGNLDVVAPYSAAPPSPGKAGIYGLSVRIGNGRGDFTERRDETVVGDLTFAVADLNGDGSLDLVVGGTRGNQVLLNRGDATFEPGPSVPSAAGLLTTDLNGDGAVDIVTYGCGFSRSVLLGHGDGSFSPTVHQPSFPACLPVLVASDATGDGVVDLVTALDGEIQFPSDLGVYPGDASGGFGALQLIPAGITGRVGALLAYDMTGDGQQDFLVGFGRSGPSDPYEFGGLSLLENLGDGVFATPRPLILMDATALAVADLNGDGLLDIAALTEDLVVLLGRADGSFGGYAHFGTPSSPKGLALGDVNGDGRTDVVVAGANGLGLLLGQQPR